MTIGDYIAQNDRFDESVYRKLDADFHLYRHYINQNGQQIDLYIGYYGTAKGGRTPHNPYACFPSAGWAILDTKEISLIPVDRNNPVKVNFMRVKKGMDSEAVVHWYQADSDKVLNDGLSLNIQRFIRLVLHNRNDGAFVRVSVRNSNDSTHDSEQMALSFTRTIIGILPEYWPEEG